MISKEQFLKLAVKYQTSQFNTAREYLQHLFLDYFYKLPQSSLIYFKGGTALKLVYGSPRFSEDLDFSTNQEDMPGIEDCLLEVLEKIEKENIQADLQESKTTTGGYLSTIEFVIFDITIPVQIEISFREKKERGEVATITSDFIPSYQVMELAQDQLISGKIRALLERKKPRDFYDLYFILRNSNLRPYLPKDRLEEVLQILQNTRINFELELKQYLPKSHWLVIRDFKRILEREIQGFI